MKRALTRPHLHSARLVRLLTDLALVASAGPGVSFAEKLGQWVDIAGAIALRAAHTACLPGPTSAAPSVSGMAIGESCARLQAALENSITRKGLPVTDRNRIELPSPKLELPVDLVTAYEPYRRYYQAHQRQLDLTIRTFRNKVRGLLGTASPALQQLANLDAALEGILSERETRLFSTVPSLLAQRFEHLFKLHQQRLLVTQQTDHPDLWMKPGGWLTRFCQELQTVLLAELEVRLQPVLGLIEALNNE